MRPVRCSPSTRHPLIYLRTFSNSHMLWPQVMVTLEMRNRNINHNNNDKKTKLSQPSRCLTFDLCVNLILCSLWMVYKEFDLYYYIILSFYSILCCKSHFIFFSLTFSLYSTIYRVSSGRSIRNSLILTWSAFMWGVTFKGRFVC